MRKYSCSLVWVLSLALVVACSPRTYYFGYTIKSKKPIDTICVEQTLRSLPMVLSVTKREYSVDDRPMTSISLETKGQASLKEVGGWVGASYDAKDIALSFGAGIRADSYNRLSADHRIAIDIWAREARNWLEQAKDKLIKDCGLKDAEIKESERKWPLISNPNP